MSLATLRAAMTEFWPCDEAASPLVGRIAGKQLTVVGGTFQVTTDMGGRSGVQLDGVDDKISGSDAAMGTVFDHGTGSFATRALMKTTTAQATIGVVWLHGDNFTGPRIQNTLRSSLENGRCQVAASDGTNPAYADTQDAMNSDTLRDMCGVVDRTAQLWRTFEAGVQRGTLDSSAMGSPDCDQQFIMGLDPVGTLPLAAVIADVFEVNNYIATAQDLLDMWNSGTPRNPMAAPDVTAITPSTGVNTGSVNITDLAGTEFDWFTAPTVKLKKAAQSDITASAVVVVSKIKITCTFALTGVAVGTWDVYITNGNGEDTLVGAFTVTAPASGGGGGRGAAMMMRGVS